MLNDINGFSLGPNWRLLCNEKASTLCNFFCPSSNISYDNVLIDLQTEVLALLCEIEIHQYIAYFVKYLQYSGSENLCFHKYRKRK